MKYLFSVTTAFFLIFSAAFAQVDTEDFNIRVLVGDDNTAPTTPILLSATPVSSSQIDLSWSSSTDNFVIGGYVIYRGTSTLATTTLLTYSDTGLTASTTYSYYVQAFDNAFNYSSSSNVIATTTPNVIVPPSTPDTEVSYGTAAKVVIDDLVVQAGVSTSSLNVVTKHPARLEIRWGRTDAYELGYIVGSVLKKEHSFSLTELEPGTTYEYEIIGYTPFGKATILIRDSFTTDNQGESLPPPNVRGFSAVTQGENVELSWDLPSIDNLAHIRIVRSHLGYPEYPVDGAVVYQGVDENYIDVGILSIYSPVYYTAFVYDKDGNVSSGAITVAYLVGEGPSDGTSDNLVDYISLPPIISEATSSVDNDRVTVDMKMPELADIEIKQNELGYVFQDTEILLDTGVPFIISVSTDVVAGNLKSIIATIIDPSDTRKSSSYLLKINKDKTAYEATIDSIDVNGDSQLRLEIFDYQAYVVANYQTPVTFADGVVKKSGLKVFEDLLFDYLNRFLAVFVALCLFFILLILWKRRKN